VGGTGVTGGGVGPPVSCRVYPPPRATPWLEGQLRAGECKCTDTTAIGAGGRGPDDRKVKGGAYEAAARRQRRGE